ncbi:ABC transporter ATP-binding protein [Aneurinibacillus sp. BA2021]|nr:ABC transporter ATP-binding protein [Aneurinibacillus sp. BA2021]
MFITIREISKRYGSKTVLQNVSLNITKGEMFGIAGENGAGKSTLLSIIASVSKPSAGEVCIDGVSVQKGGSKVKRRIGYVPQELALYPSLRGIDNLSFWGKMYGVRGSELALRMEEVMDIIGLRDRIKERVDAYSGGMKRRLNLGVAMLHRPDLLILDEPTAGVDVQSRRQIMQALKEMSAQGCTILYTSHHLEEIEACDRIGVLQGGEILAVGTAQEVEHHLKGEQLHGSKE